MVDLGYNYRLTDFQSALGISQLAKLDAWLARREAIARSYDEAFDGIQAVNPLAIRPDVVHAYHLYVVQLEVAQIRGGRAGAYRALRDQGIGVNVHYMPVHLQPYYRQLGFAPGQYPEAEAHGAEAITLPMYPGLTDDQQDHVVRVLESLL